MINLHEHFRLQTTNKFRVEGNKFIKIFTHNPNLLQLKHIIFYTQIQTCFFYVNDKISI